MERSNLVIYMDKEETRMLKGIAIWMVLVSHIGYFSGLMPSVPLGACGVYIFLFLSGYGLMRSVIEKGLQRYWIKRIKNVYFPYLIVLIFVLVLAIIVRNSVGINFIKYLFFIDYPFGEYWYLLIQVEWYIAFFLVWNMKLKFSLNFKWIIIWMVAADILIVFLNMSDRKFLWTLGAFVMGGGIGFYGIQVFNKIRNTYLTIGLIAMIVIAGIIKKLPWVETHELGVVDTICQMIIIFCTAALIVFYAESIVKRVYGIKVMLLVFGDYSYEIYLTHSVYIEMLKNVAEKPIWQKISVILIFIGLTVVSTLILRCLVKQMNIIYQRKVI